MNKYQYYYNHKPVTLKKMKEELRKCCLEVVNTIPAGVFSVDITEVNEKEFNRALRQITRGITVLYCDGYSNGATFYRRKI